MGHETAHHIQNHIRRREQDTALGVEVFARLAEKLDSDENEIENAKAIGAAVGARYNSKAFELEADELGTVITKKAGYDPLKGAEFFARIPDPGNRFLGTHPPNAQRLETVRRVASRL